MKNTFSKIVLASAVLATLATAGKDVIEVEVPVEPVAYMDALPWYVGAGLVWSGAERDCSCQSDTVKDTAYGYALRAGYDFNEFIGIEARYLKANMKSDVQDLQHYGIYAKPQYHITDSINVYALLGYGKTELDCSNTTTALTLEKKGFNWGLGLEFDVTSDKADGVYARGFDGMGDQETSWGVYVDYQNLLRDEGNSNTNTNIVTAGVTYDF